MGYLTQIHYQPENMIIYVKNKIALEFLFSYKYDFFNPYHKRVSELISEFDYQIEFHIRCFMNIF